jgi:hypothetical protein
VPHCFKNNRIFIQVRQPDTGVSASQVFMGDQLSPLASGASNRLSPRIVSPRNETWKINDPTLATQEAATSPREPETLPVINSPRFFTKPVHFNVPHGFSDRYVPYKEP